MDIISLGNNRSAFRGLRYRGLLVLALGIVIPSPTNWEGTPLPEVTPGQLL